MVHRLIVVVIHGITNKQQRDLYCYDDATYDSSLELFPACQML
jgi:hypothetical protein